MANILTASRILFGLLILFFPAFSKEFFVLYILGGFTDAVDGTVARKFSGETEFGAKLDTAADIVFVFSVLIKVISYVYFPVWLIVWIILIAAIKVLNAVYGYVKYKKFVTVHSYLNKACGLFIFTVPFFIGFDFTWQEKYVFFAFVCIMATIAAIKEFFDIRKYRG